jgi:hypothetical protein
MFTRIRVWSPINRHEQSKQKNWHGTPGWWNVSHVTRHLLFALVDILVIQYSESSLLWDPFTRHLLLATRSICFVTHAQGCSTLHNILRALFYLTHFLFEKWDSHACQARIYRLQMGIPGLCLYFGCFHCSFLTVLQRTTVVRSSQCCTWSHSHHGWHILTDIRLLCHPWLRWLCCQYSSQLPVSSISRWIFVVPAQLDPTSE